MLTSKDKIIVGNWYVYVDIDKEISYWKVLSKHTGKERVYYHIENINGWTNNHYSEQSFYEPSDFGYWRKVTRLEKKLYNLI